MMEPVTLVTKKGMLRMPTKTRRQMPKTTRKAMTRPLDQG